MTDLAPLLLTVLAAAAVIFGWIGVRALLSHESMSGVRDWVSVFVEAAEQALDGTPGHDKLLWVLDKLKQRFPKLDDGLLHALVEAAVYRMKQEKELLK